MYEKRQRMKPSVRTIVRSLLVVVTLLISTSIVLNWLFGTSSIYQSLWSDQKIELDSVREAVASEAYISAVSTQRTFLPVSTPHYSFVKFSSYRISLHTFFVTGITSNVARDFEKERIVHSCEWHPSNGTRPMVRYTNQTEFKVTDAKIIYVKIDEHNRGNYHAVIINCTFGEEVAGNGGLLVLQVATGLEDLWTPAGVLEEQPGDVDIVKNPPKEVPFQYAFCGPPLHGPVRGDWVHAWVTYHHYFWKGKAHFFFYNLGGLSEGNRRLFDTFIDEGFLSMTDLGYPQSQFPTWYYHQVLFINDCLHRSRFLAKHVFFFDYDEFLQVPPPETLETVLEKYENAPWITFGNIPSDIHHCRLPRKDNELPIERMLWRSEAPKCGRRRGDPWKCGGSAARRKYCVNPHKVFVAGVHFPTFPAHGGIDLNAKLARLIHYRGALSNVSNLCDKEEPSSRDADKINILEQDENIARTFALAKLYPVQRNSTTNVFLSPFGNNSLP